MVSTIQKIGIFLLLSSLIIMGLIFLSGTGDVGDDLLNEKPEIECQVEYYGGIFPDDSLYINNAKCIYSGEKCRNIVKSSLPFSVFKTSGDIIFQTSDGVRKTQAVDVLTLTKETTSVILCSESSSVIITTKNEDGIQTDSTIVNIV